jgi:hypothetical protein
LPGLAAEFAFLLNESDLSRPLTGSDSIKGADLPNVADAGVRVSIDYTTRLADDMTLSLGGWARYVGRSYLGVSPSLLIRQGRYTDTAIEARLTRGKLGLSLQVDNVLDTIGNRFSLGNPFGVMEGLQTTPLHPRSVRVGLDVSF